MPAGGAVDLNWNRLDQRLESGLGILKYGLAVADKEGVEVEIQEPAPGLSLGPIEGRE